MSRISIQICKNQSKYKQKLHRQETTVKLIAHNHKKCQQLLNRLVSIIPDHSVNQSDIPQNWQHWGYDKLLEHSSAATCQYITSCVICFEKKHIKVSVRFVCFANVINKSYCASIIIINNVLGN